VAFPAVFLFIREPTKAKTAPKGALAQSSASERPAADLEVRECFGGHRFWLIACALLLVSTVTQVVRAHSASLDGQRLFTRDGGNADDCGWPFYDGRRLLSG